MARFNQIFRIEMRSLCLKYAEDVVKLEWPAMEAKQPMPPDSRAAIQGLWKLAGQSQANAGLDSIASYQLLEELRTLSECRRIRLMHSQEELPGILRAVLIAGGIITVAAACFFGVPSFRFHLLQVIVLTFLISLVLVAIADLGSALPGERNRATDRLPVGNCCLQERRLRAGSHSLAKQSRPSKTTGCWSAAMKN